MAHPDTTQLKSLLESARSVSILLPQNPDYDTVASGLALRLVLESVGRSATVVCPDQMTVEFNRLVGVNTITSSWSSRDLLIGFADQTDHVDKISYNLEEGELRLVITPKPDAPHLDHRKLRFIAAAGKPDLHLLVGVDTLDSLGSFSVQVRDSFTASPPVAFTHSLPRQNFTPHHFYDPDTSSLSELVTHIIDALGLSMPPDAATNLLAGMETATQNFQSGQVTVTTFESAAYLLRRGARRQQVFRPDNLPPGSIPQSPVKSDKPDSKEPPPDWYEPKVYSGPILP